MQLISNRNSTNSINQKCFPLMRLESRENRMIPENLIPNFYLKFVSCYTKILRAAAATSFINHGDLVQWNFPTNITRNHLQRLENYCVKNEFRTKRFMKQNELGLK